MKNFNGFKNDYFGGKMQNKNDLRGGANELPLTNLDFK